MNAAHGSEFALMRNTLLSAIEAHTETQMCRIQCRKTGSKDEKSPWANARPQFTSQLCCIFKCGHHTDNGTMRWEECHHMQVDPIWTNGMMWVDESHDQCVIGGSDHDGSSRNIQWRIAIDPATGALKRVTDRG